MTESVPDRESSENERSQLADSSVRSRKRIRRLLVVGSLLILLFGPYLFYRATSFGERVRVFSEDGPVAVAPETLRVMIWNIAHGRGVEDSNWSETAEPKVDRILEIAELIKQQDADVVILNEVDYAATWSGNFDQAAAIADVTGYPYYARQTNLDFGFLVGRFKFGNVILSRYPIVAAEALDLPAFVAWEDWLVGRKRGLLCDIQLGEQQIVVAGLHLEARGEPSRIKSVKYLLERIQQLRSDGRPSLILAGDLNTTPSHAPNRKRKYTAEGYRLPNNSFDTLAEESGLTHVPAKITDASQFTFPSTAPRSAIDWVFFDDASFKATSHRVLQSELSDHLPVVVDLQIRK